MIDYASWLREIKASYKHYDITPIPKPRLTHQGRFSDRAKRYYKYCNDLNMMNLKINECGSHIVFVLPMPKSWSGRIRDALRDTPHKTKNSNDVDNLVKAVMDAVFKNDGHVWDIRASKFWGDDGAIYVKK